MLCEATRDLSCFNFVDYFYSIPLQFYDIHHASTKCCVHQINYIESSCCRTLLQRCMKTCTTTGVLVLTTFAHALHILQHHALHIIESRNHQMAYRHPKPWSTPLHGSSREPRGGGLGSSTIFKNLMSPTPRRKWYLTTGRRAH